MRIPDHQILDDKSHQGVGSGYTEAIEAINHRLHRSKGGDKVVTLEVHSPLIPLWPLALALTSQGMGHWDQPLELFQSSVTISRLASDCQSHAITLMD